MEGLLHELVKESDNLETILRSRVPKGSDFALQWTLNRVVKKKVEHVGQVIDDVINKLNVAFRAAPQKDDAPELTQNPQEQAVQTLHLLQRKIDYSLRLANHSGIGIVFKKPGEKITLYQQLTEDLLGPSAPAKTSTDKPPQQQRQPQSLTRRKRSGANFTWLFQPRLRAIHKLSNAQPISYSARRVKLAEDYRCKGLSFEDCFEYFEFCQAWHDGEEKSAQPRSPYAEEIEAMERVFGNQEDDAWGYEIRKAVRSTLFKISEPAPLRPLPRGPGGTVVKAASRAAGTDLVIMIESKEALKEFLQHLLQSLQPLHPGQVPAVAIDVEFSAIASYRGRTALIQLSTLECDYIIDPLKINDYDSLHELNQITANPGILKVMHGICHDVEWLQQDFGIYFVNIFDTFYAAKELNVPGGFSLYNLVLLYADIALNKSQQLSDWRVRPLTETQVQYAREDTRYLLHVFGKIRNQLLSATTQPYQWKGIVSTTTGSASGRPDRSHSTHLGRRVMLSVLHSSQTVAARLVDWSPLNIGYKIHRLRESSARVSDLTQAQTFAAEIVLCYRDLLARDRDVSPASICDEKSLYLALCQYLRIKQDDAFRKLDRVPLDFIKQVQNYLNEAINKFKEGKEGNHQQQDFSKKRRLENDTVAQKSRSPNTQPLLSMNEPSGSGAASGGVSSAGVVSVGVVGGVKRRKLLMTEVDKIKSERADDGAISVVNDLALDEAGDVGEDIEVILEGFYQAGVRKVACFEKKGNQTSKSIKELESDHPPWLCVLDRTILS